MKIIFRITSEMLEQIRIDLARPHPFAFERVGFISVRRGSLVEGQLLLAVSYHPVRDEHYIKAKAGDLAGAIISRYAISEAMQEALTTGDGIFHIHMHHFDSFSEPFSRVDLKSLNELMPSFYSVSKNALHGALLMTPKHILGKYWTPDRRAHNLQTISVVGHPTISSQKKRPLTIDAERYSRQSFLGDDSDEIISKKTIGIVGVGGGGSHIVQQLSHLGFKKFVLYDPDIISISNLNRTVGATEEDVRLKTKKIEIAGRVIKSLHKDASIKAIDKRWQAEPEPLRECDIVFGCVDRYRERHELEISMRRYLIPYIDLGLTLVHHKPRPPFMSGHVFLSMPGKPCMWCLGILSESKVAEETKGYGDTGHQPQVVWGNGVLASTAVGIAVDLVTEWTQKTAGIAYLTYEGNAGTLNPSTRLKEIDLTRQCKHHQLVKVGDPIF
jgi:hypothetical protein